jgi:glycine/D-amino acid oxidase-like deaminating enzyme
MDLVSPQPFWLLKNGLLSTYPSLKEDVRCDVVVLGGGVSGAFAAESLTRAGMDVVVIDKRDVGTGSTCASTALLSYEIDTHLTELTRRIGRTDAERAYRVCHDSIDGIERMVNELQIECAFQRKPSTYLAVARDDAAALREEWTARREAGIAVQYLDAADVAARFSFSRPAALVSVQGAQLDGHRLTHALLARAAAQGARIFDRTCGE